MELSGIFLYLTMLMSFVPLIIYSWRRRAMQKQVKFLVPFMWLIATAALYEIVATMIFHLNSTIWFRFYLLLEFAALCYFFYNLLGDQKRQWLYFFGILFLGSFLVITFKWENNSQYANDSYLSIIETLFVFCGVFLWFRNILGELYVKSLWQNPIFYFLCGLILYFSGTIFLFICSDYLATLDENLLLQYWTLNVFFSFVLRAFIIIGLWKGQQTSIRYSG